MNKLLRRIKNLFKKKEEKAIVLDEVRRFPSARPTAREWEEKEEKKRIAIREIRKRLKKEAIRSKNIERRRSTLGHGLKGKLKPRPAFEKKTWKLDKKMEDDD